MAVDTYTYLRRLGYLGTTAQMLDQHRRDTTNTVVDANIPTTETVAYNADGTVLTDTVDTETTTYTYNTDGSIATDTKNGVIRTYTYSALGNLLSILEA